MTDTRSSRPGVSVLLEVLRRRDRVASLSEDEWAAFLRSADAARLLPRLSIELERLGLTSPDAPEWARDRLAAAAIRGRQYEREIWWEIRCIHQGLGPAGIDPVFLKGAAYVAAGLPSGVGRVAADLDILVAESDLSRVEAALLAAGWEFDGLDAYDERYYREWMHELPPMRHKERGTLLDVHHRILPRTGRVHPPTSRLLASAVTVGHVRILSPAHRLLHAAAHLFQDGEVVGSLRDLVDIADLAGPVSLADIVDEVETFGLGRALYYAVRYAERFGLLILSDQDRGVIARWAPGRAAGHAMDALVETVFRASGLGGTASALLMARSHWLKMPPGMLLSHTWHKARRALLAP
jgi:hypothetical protein